MTSSFSPLIGTRLLVADGGCGRSVGSASVIDALRTEAEHHPTNLEVIPTGCDGRCFDAVTVTLMEGDQGLARWTKVSSQHARRICDFVASHSAMQASPSEVTDPFFTGQRRVLLASAGSRNPESYDDAIERGGFIAFRQALKRKPQEIIDAIDNAGLLGMGGAFFPSGRKWRSCAMEPGPRYLVVNAEEGEPGVFKDRHLMEENPHRLIEGALIAAYAIGAQRVYVYVNGQAHLSSHRVQLALNAAREDGLVGDGILGGRFSCEIDLREGAGGYVLGEESVILESIEGRRPTPRFRPPHVVQQGLWGQPTAVDNVETLSRVPPIISATFGQEDFSPAEIAQTKLICITGDVIRPGIVEVPFGTSIRDIVLGMAGGPQAGRSIRAVLVGGPSGKIVPPALFDRPLTPQEQDVLLGSGNLIALDDRRSLMEVVRRLAHFNADESCGKCTPCREGANRIALLMDAARDAAALVKLDPELQELGDILRSTSLCGLGRMAPNPILSALKNFSADELLEKNLS
jgi:NADH-quinone oxidoreductase subunit F